MSENETKDEKVTDLPTKSATAAAEARQQAEVYGSAFASHILKLDDGTEIDVPPHPSLRMFDDEAMTQLDQLNLDLESYDRHPNIDVPEQKVYDERGNLQMTLPAKLDQPGPLKTHPHRKTDPVTGEVNIMSPPYEVRVAQLAIGQENYAKLRAGTVNGHRGRASDVWRIWHEQGQEVADRRRSDPKSGQGSVDLETVSSPDSE